jgi:hypothetical protein
LPSALSNGYPTIHPTHPVRAVNFSPFKKTTSPGVSKTAGKVATSGRPELKGVIAHTSIKVER